VTDDTAAIQAAIDSGAKLIFIPKGTYKTSQALSVEAGVSIYGEGDGSSQISFGAKAFEQLNTSLPSSFMASSIKDLYLLGDLSASPTIGIELKKTWGVDISNVRIRNVAIAIKDESSLQNSYDLITTEGRLIFTGTRTTDLASDLRVTRIKQTPIESTDSAIKVQNCVNSIFSKIHQNCPTSSSDSNYSTTRIGIEILDQSEGIFFDSVFSVGLGIGFKIDDSDGGNPPLVCKISNSIFDQYISSGGVIQNCNGFDELGNQYTYQLTDAANGVSTIVGSEALRYKQIGNTYLETRLEAALVRSGSSDTDFYSIDCENCGQASANTYAAVRIQGNTTKFSINGINVTGTQHSQAVFVQSGSSNQYYIRDVKCVGNSIAKVTDSGSGADKYVESGIPKFTASVNFSTASSALNRDAIIGDIALDQGTGKTLTKSATGTTQPWRTSDGTIEYTPS
jgi:hypothetical protein